MAQDYVVNYQINVNNQKALDAIRQFSQAAQQMEGLVRRFDAVSRSIGKANGALSSIGKTPIAVKVDTAQAEAKLNNILSLLRQIKRESASKLVGGASSAAGSVRANTSRAVGGFGNTTNLGNLNKKIADTQKAINGLNQRQIHPKANVGTAINSLDKLLAKIEQIKSNSKITITASAAGASGAIAAGASGTGRVRSAGAPVVLRRNFPTMRSVTGPVYAGTGATFAGEMVKGMGLAYGLSTLMSGVAGVFKDATNYQNISQTTRNILATHDKQPNFEGRWDSVNKLMRQVGVETKFTAPQVASAGRFLAMAGLDLNQIRSSINPISNIALVGDTDLGETADLMTNIMTGYQIPANQMNRAADILTMTFTKSNTTLTTLAESFKYAGTVAHQAGIDFSTASAAIGVLGDAGIQASHAGTTLRMMLLNMQNPTKKAKEAWDALGVKTKDAHGNLRNLVDILEDLNKKRQQMSQGDFATMIGKMFRVTAAPGALALIQNADKVREVAGLNNNESYGISERLADAKKNTIEGLWYQMTSAFTESGMKGFEQMQGAIRDFLQRMIALMKSPGFATTLRDMMSLFLNTLQAIVDVFKKLMSMWNALPQWGKSFISGFIKIQLYLSMFLGVWKSIYGVGLSFVGVLGNALVKLSGIIITMRNIYAVQGSMAAIRGVFTAGAVSSLGGTVLGAGATGIGIGANAAKMSQYGLIGNALKAIGSFFLTNPWGWAIAAVGVLGAVAWKIYETKKRTDDAIAATNAWGESYRKFGVDKANFQSADDVAARTLGIMNSSLLDQKEKLEAATEAWRNYYLAKENKGPEADKTKPYIETPEGQQYKNDVNNVDLSANTLALFQAMGGRVIKQYSLDANGRSVPNYKLDFMGLNWRNPGIDANGNAMFSENYGAQAVIAKMVLDNQTLFDNYRKSVVGNIWKANSVEDILGAYQIGMKAYMPNVPVNPVWNVLDKDKLGKMTLADIQSSEVYQSVLHAALMEQQAKISELYGSMVADMLNNKPVGTQRIYDVFAQQYAILQRFNGEVFGTEGWMNRLAQLYVHPSLAGLQNSDQVAQAVGDAFKGILDTYNSASAQVQRYMSAFLNRNVWTFGMPANLSLPEGGFYGGHKKGDKTTINGKIYTWDWKFVGGDNWYDSNGNPYTPRSAAQTTATQAYAGSGNKRWNAGGGGKNKKNWTSSLHNGTDQSKYKSHNTDHSAVPKQVIVHIQNLLKIDKQQIDWNNPQQVAAVENIKQRMAEALLDVVQDFNANIV